MSWSFNLVFCSTDAPERLTTSCQHDAEKAAKIISELGFPVVETKISTFDDALSLPPGHIAVGAYRDIIAFSDPAWLLGKVGDKVLRSVSGCSSVPTAQVLHARTAGVVSHGVFSLWDHGHLIRRFEADPGNGVSSFGDFLPEEKAEFESASESNGRWTFTVRSDGKKEEVDAFSIEEALTFAAMSRFIGVPYDRWSGDEPLVSVFRLPRMGWFSRLRTLLLRCLRRAGLDPSIGDNAFVPRNWDAFFSTLSPEERRAAAIRVCRAVLVARCTNDMPLREAVDSLERETVTAEQVSAVKAILERLESEYDRLVGDDEAKLAHDDPIIKQVFQNARAAQAVSFALEGALSDMAYEAWFALDADDLKEIRRLVGMPEESWRS